MGLANSRALEIAKVTKATADPPNGHIMRDATGSPTGEFKETAQASSRVTFLRNQLTINIKLLFSTWTKRRRLA